MNGRKQKRKTKEKQRPEADKEEHRFYVTGN